MCSKERPAICLSSRSAESFGHCFILFIVYFGETIARANITMKKCTVVPNETLLDMIIWSIPS